MWVPIQYKKPAALSEVFGRWKFAEKAKATLTRRIVDHLDENLKKVAKQIAWKPASDPAMPLGAKKAFEHIIGGLMIEVNAFIMSQLKAVLHVHAVSNWQTSNEQSASSLDEHVFGISCYEICNISVFNHLVAWFRYKNYPADKDIWSQLYDPWFWIFRIICVWPTSMRTDWRVTHTHTEYQPSGAWPTDGYDHEESKSIDGGKFVGLACDEDNQPDLSEERVNERVDRADR